MYTFRVDIEQLLQEVVICAADADVISMRYIYVCVSVQCISVFISVHCVIERFHEMKQCPGTYFITVIEDVKKSEVVGAATLVVEQKFIHNAAVVSFALFPSLTVMRKVKTSILGQNWHFRSYGNFCANFIFVVLTVINCFMFCCYL